MTHDLGRRSDSIGGLEYLFNSPMTSQIAGVNQRVIVVTPIAPAREMALAFQIHDQPLKDVLPMGHLGDDGRIKRWSNRFGVQEPILIVASDLDAASEFAECEPDRCNLAVVNANWAQYEQSRQPT